MKKFTTIVMTCLIMLVVVLTGCSTFSVDKVKYYNEVLAKVGDENITRFDLVTAYNSYGYTNYVTQAGQTEKEALLSTMDLLVQRKLTVKHAKDNFDKYGLSEYEINNVYRETIDYLLESVATNMDTARKLYNLEVNDTEDAEEESAESFKMSEYDHAKRVEVVNGQIKYKDIDTEKDADAMEPVLEEKKYISHYNDYTQSRIVKELLAKFKKELYTNANNEDEDLYEKVCDKAIELTCNNLISYEHYLRENGEKLSTNREDVLFRFVERAYENQLESAYITKVNTYYLKNETLSNESIINAFKALYENDYAKYVNDANAYNTNIIKTNADLIYYHPNTDADFGYFLHVLLPLNNVEDDLTWLKEHRHLYTDAEYKAEQQALINQIMCAERTTEEVRDTETGELLYEEGVTLESEKSILDVLQEYSDDVRDLASFKKFMFRYTTDNATLTADMPYIIGYNAETEEEYSSMVKNFTAEAIRLMKENKSYTGSNEYILTNHGVHLLYYVGPVVNQISIEDINKVTVDKLNNTVLNVATGETYLDRVFDLVYPAGDDGMFTSNTKYSSYEKNLVDSLYAKYPVTLYKTKIKASNKV